MFLMEGVEGFIRFACDKDCYVALGMWKTVQLSQVNEHTILELLTLLKVLWLNTRRGNSYFLREKLSLDVAAGCRVFFVRGRLPTPVTIEASTY